MKNDAELDVLGSPASGLPSVDSARHLVSEIKSRWDDGETADASKVLTNHPELLATKSIVLDLAYEEYCQRAEAGEQIDPILFCERFPLFRESLRRLIEVHRYLEQNPQLLPGRLRDWPQVGQTFLGFRLLDELGRGAFGRVFLAAEPALGQRRVAVKISLHGATEAQTLGRLEHPNIVPVNSVQVDNASGLTAICMPYLGSKTLCDVLQYAFAKPEMPTRSNVFVDALRITGSSDTPPTQLDPLLRNRTYAEGVVHLMVQLAEALAYAHAKGVCHCDLKPSNVLVTPGGRPMLLDFNLCFDERNAGNACAGGTIPYMSPEQLLAIGPTASISNPVGARSDIFSLGVILYELLYGSLPFGPVPLDCPLGTIQEDLLNRQKAGPRPLHLAAQVDRNLLGLVQRCLAFDPKDRIESAFELAEGLRRYLSPWQRTRRRVNARRRIVMVGASLLMGVVFGGLYSLSVRDPYSLRQLERGRHAYGEGNFREAIKYLNQAVDADPKLAAAAFTRGRAYQQLDEVSLALADYLAADRLARDGLTQACIGYCHTQLNSQNAAIWSYEKAIEFGFVSARVLNNLGYCYALRLEYERARPCLDQAIELEPKLQAAYYNRAMLEWRRVVRTREPVPESVKLDMDTAITIGPPTAELLCNAARVYALAARDDRECIELALRYLQKAIEFGQDPGPLKSDLSFIALRGLPQFITLLQLAASPATPQPAVRFLDPLTPLPN